MAREYDVSMRELIEVENLTYAEAAARLHIGRNTAISIGHRLGLASSHSPKVRGGRPKSKFPRPPIAEFKDQRRHPPQMHKINQPKIVAAPTRPIPTSPHPSLDVTFENLAAGQCKWPVNDGAPFLFCGYPQDTSVLPYCDFHNRLAYQPSDRRSERQAAWLSGESSAAIR